MSPYYTDDFCTIYHGDCREVLPQITAGSIVTDPPYGVGVKYGDGYDDARKAYWPWFQTVLDAMLASACAPVVFTHQIKALEKIHGWDWVGVWNKPGSFTCRVGNSSLLPHWEPIFIFKVFGQGTSSQYRSDVYTFNPIPGGNKAGRARGRIGRSKWAAGEHVGHPCPKPEGFMRELIATFAQDQDVPVVDPFMGSGTTLAASKMEARTAIGIEIEEKYCEIAANRLRQEVLW